MADDPRSLDKKIQTIVADWHKTKPDSSPSSQISALDETNEVEIITDADYNVDGLTPTNPIFEQPEENKSTTTTTPGLSGLIEQPPTFSTQIERNPNIGDSHETPAEDNTEIKTFSFIEETDYTADIMGSNYDPTAVHRDFDPYEP